MTEIKKPTREELIEAKNKQKEAAKQREEFLIHKKNLKEVVDYLELEYKELYYRIEIPKLKHEYFTILDEHKKKQEEAKSLKEQMEGKLNETQSQEVNDEANVIEEKPKKSKVIKMSNKE